MILNHHKLCHQIFNGHRHLKQKISNIRNKRKKNKISEVGEPCGMHVRPINPIHKINPSIHFKYTLNRVSIS